MANDFSGDANLQGLWLLESGALTTDSSGNGNTFTDYNTVGTSATCKQGSYSGDFERNNAEYLARTDGGLNANFPFKNGGAGTLSWCAWVKPESFVAGEYHPIFCKHVSGGTSYGIFLYCNDAGSVQVYKAVANNSSAGQETITYGTALSTGTWYHIAFTYNNTTKAYLLRVWDDTAGDYLDTDLSGSFTSATTTFSTADFCIGSRSGYRFWDGLIDEAVVFNDILSTTEIDQIRAGTYGAAGATVKPWNYYAQQ